MKVESAQSAGRVDVGYEGKREIRGDSTEFSLTKHNNGKSCYHMKEKENIFGFGHVGLEMPIRHVDGDVIYI